MKDEMVISTLSTRIRGVMCAQRYVRKVISHENAFDLFAETYTKHKQQISIECLYFIEEHFSKLLKHNRTGFRQLPEAVLAEVLKSDRLSVGDEYMLFLALVDWGRAALAREQPELVPSSLSSSSASSSSASSSSSLSSSSSSSSLPLPLPSATSPALTDALRRRLASLVAHIRFPMMSPQGAVTRRTTRPPFSCSHPRACACRVSCVCRVVCRSRGGGKDWAGAGRAAL
jgi:hypothetical protein